MKFIHHLHELKASKWPCHASGGYSPASHHGGPGSTQASLCEIYGVQSGILLLHSFAACQYHSHNAPHSYSPPCCCHLNGQSGETWEPPKKSNSLSEMGKHWLQTYF